jgi:hypothetical protein
LDPGSGPFFDDIFLQYLQNPCYVYLYNTGLLFTLTHKTINCMKKLCLLLLPLFYIGLGSGIRDEQILGSGSGIKHPGSATLGLPWFWHKSMPWYDILLFRLKHCCYSVSLYLPCLSFYIITGSDQSRSL